MCLTSKNVIFSWGMGQSGRLGHGDEDDMLFPKEISFLMRGKPTYISAGESHNACITDRFCLYTWGNGQYGRLGHGFDSNEKKPKQVEELDKQDVIQVSCGAFHTLVVTL
jgi:E3 ubiquitin-protein ligase HERC2